MDACRYSFKVIGLLIGAWGFVLSLLFSIAFTIREDAWQIFGGTMLLIITVLGELDFYFELFAIRLVEDFEITFNYGMLKCLFYCSTQCDRMYRLDYWDGLRK